MAKRKAPARNAKSDKITKRVTAIYALLGEDGRVRYVGKANDPATRFAQHFRNSRAGHTPLYVWISAELAAGRNISWQVLEWVPPSVWEETERRLIALHRAGGDLLNVADGGDQPQRSEEAGANRIWFLKNQLSIGLRRGLLGAETKAKMREAAICNPAMFGKWANI